MPAPFILSLLDASLQILKNAVGMGGTYTASATSDVFDLAQGTPLPSFPWSEDGGGAHMDLVIPVTSYKVSATNEVYEFYIQDSADGSTNWTTWSRTAVLGSGATETPPTPGHVIIPWAARNEFLRLQLVISGTSPTITIGTPFISPKVNVAAR